MTQEEKQLLLQDLCARLLYNPWVLVEFEGSNQEWKTTLQQEYCVGYISGKITKLYSREITVKPYLRPLTSMTEDEEIEFCMTVFDTVLRITEKKHTCIVSFEQINWLNAHHFDYRGLIEKGLALEAPEGMYNAKQQ